MSTTDVPGANAANRDVLAAGCWAEHEDGSLLYVKGTENEQVVYELYDLAQDPPITYQDAMRERDFKVAFSYAPNGTSKDKWIWHDKTPFPWHRVMKSIEKPRPRYADVHDELSAAARVARDLRLRQARVEEAAVAARTDQEVRKGGIFGKLQRAFAELRK